LTGPGALIGTQQMRGIQFADRSGQRQGRRARQQDRGVFEDNQAKPDQSILSFNKLTDLEHVQVIFTAYSGPSLAMAPLATRKKVLMINAGAQADKLATASPYLINTLADDRRRDQGDVEIPGRGRQEEGRHPVRERRRRHFRPRRLSWMRFPRPAAPSWRRSRRSSARPTSGPRC
jgi:hypothetical protein